MVDAKIGSPAPVLGAGPPLVPALGGAGPITVVEGTTFCLSSPTGDVGGPAYASGMFGANNMSHSVNIPKTQTNYDGTPCPGSPANHSFSGRPGCLPFTFRET